MKSCNTTRTGLRLAIKALSVLAGSISLVSWGQQASAKPLLDSPLSSQLSTFDSSKLSGDERRSFDVLTLIVADVDAASIEVDRLNYLLEFLAKSPDFLAKQSNALPVWAIRADAALEVNQPVAGREACQKLIKLKAGDMDDPGVREILAMLDRRGWFKPATSDTTDPKPARPRPFLQQEHTRPAILENNQFGTSNVGPVAFSAKWSGYRMYLHKFIENIQIHWDRILIESRTEPPSGTSVTIKFRMDSKGTIAEIIEVESTSTEEGKQSCLTALTTSGPYEKWTPDMVEVLGISQVLTFQFYYQ